MAACCARRIFPRGTTCRVDGSAVHAVMVTGADVGFDDLAANYHRVDGEAD